MIGQNSCIVSLVSLTVVILIEVDSGAKNDVFEAQKLRVLEESRNKSFDKISNVLV